MDLGLEYFPASQPPRRGKEAETGVWTGRRKVYYVSCPRDFRQVAARITPGFLVACGLPAFFFDLARRSAARAESRVENGDFLEQRAYSTLVLGPFDPRVWIGDVMRCDDRCSWPFSVVSVGKVVGCLGARSGASALVVVTMSWSLGWAFEFVLSGRHLPFAQIPEP